MQGERREFRPADYLSFPSNFPEHIKVKPFIKKYGDEGLAFVTRLCCFLAEQPGFEFPYTERDLKDVAENYEYEYERFKELITFAKEREFIYLVTFEGKWWIRCEFLETVCLERLLARREYRNKYMRDRRTPDNTKDIGEIQNEKEEDVGPAGT